jgi:hypothetical protein
MSLEWTNARMGYYEIGNEIDANPGTSGNGNTLPGPNH